MSFVYYNPNPANKLVGDCVIRAISKIESISWERTFIEIAVEAFYLADMPSSNYVWGSYLKQKGYIRKNLPDTCPDCYTLQMFCREHPKGKYLVSTGTHLVAVQDGNVFDSWDSSDETVISYYEKANKG